MLFNAGRHGENIGVENDVLGRKTDFIDQQIIGPFANLIFAVRRIGLAGFIKRHDNHRRAIFTAQMRLLEELRLALFK